MWGRAIAVGLLVMAVEFMHGTIFLRPRVGDFRSGQIAVLTGSVLFPLIGYFCEPWMTLRSFADGWYNLLHGGGIPVGLGIFAMTPWMVWRLRQASRKQ